MGSVNIRVFDDQSKLIMEVLGIPHRHKMDLQDAMEVAKSMNTNFYFDLEYFGFSNGQYLGYMVTMIASYWEYPLPPVKAKEGETSKYWFIKVNDRDSNSGIDSIYLRDNDEIELILKDYLPEIYSNTIIGIKHKLRLSQQTA
jgi:hypothetical protein